MAMYTWCSVRSSWLNFKLIALSLDSCNFLLGSKEFTLLLLITSPSEVAQKINSFQYASTDSHVLRLIFLMLGCYSPVEQSLWTYRSCDEIWILEEMSFEGTQFIRWIREIVAVKGLIGETYSFSRCIFCLENASFWVLSPGRSSIWFSIFDAACWLVWKNSIYLWKSREIASPQKQTLE